MKNIRNVIFKIKKSLNKLRDTILSSSEIFLLIASITSIFTIIYRLGFGGTAEDVMLLHRINFFILLTFLVGLTGRYIINYKDIILERLLYVDLTLYVLIIGTLISGYLFREEVMHNLPFLSFFTAPAFVNLLLFTVSTTCLSRQLFEVIKLNIRPSRLFISSFLFVILVGAGLLMLPQSTHTNISMIDALFMATTSVCVTGLTTVDVASTFTLHGQIILLFLIQIGGIGVMTFTSFFALSFMGKTQISHQIMLKDMLNEDNLNGLFQTIVYIILTTLLIEGIGAYLIWREIRGALPGGTGNEIFYAIFHSISAFCNAGISTLSGNLYDPLVRHNYGLHFWIAILIILGGLGFPIVFNYMKLLRHAVVNAIKIALGIQKRYKHMPFIINVHTRIVMNTTIILLVVGTILYYITEQHNTLEGMDTKQKLITSFFGSVTPRTAGFNTVDMGLLSNGALILTCILMIIGASPMSTGGGIKTSTFAIAFLTSLNFAKNKEKLELYRREMMHSTIRRAFVIIMFYMIWICIASFLLSISEKDKPIFALVFEVISALGTVGLSLNLTPTLSEFSKVLIILTMFIGRIGVFMFISSFLKETTPSKYNYPKDSLLLG